MDFNGHPTDKDSYLPTYQGLAQTLPINAAVCELGVFQGGSLALWQSLFPHSKAVVGVDRNPESIWPQGTIKVVSDQEDPGLVELLLAHAPQGYHLIVDDASHLGRLTFLSFQHLWPLVAPGGYYVIEDWGVGFPAYPNYDDSMLTMAMMLLMKLEHESSLHFITYQRGLILLRKKEE